MKKKVIFAIVVCTIALTAALSFSQKAQEETHLTDLALNNTEALAYDTTCPNGCVDSDGSCNCRGRQPYAEANWPPIPSPPPTHLLNNFLALRLYDATYLFN